jgi:hypothetical protein
LDLPRRLDDFKWAEAMKLKRQFEGWGADERDARLGLLNRVIAKHVSASVACVLPHADFRRAWGRFVTRHPYTYLAYGLIRELANHQATLGLGEAPIDFIFDDNVMEKTRLCAAWDHFKANAQAPRWLLGAEPLFRDEKELRPLQAADLLAGLTRLRWNERESGEEPYDVPGADQAARIPAITFVWTEDLLQRDLAEFFRLGPKAASSVLGNYWTGRPLVRR